MGVGVVVPQHPPAQRAGRERAVLGVAGTSPERDLLPDPEELGRSG